MSARRGWLLVRLEQAGRFAEDLALVLLLGGMIILAALQILLRNFFDTGLVWGDELLRILVLWLGLLGAVAASRDDNQIRIDVLSRFLPERPRLAVRSIVDLFTATVCGVLAWQAAVFVHGAWEYEETVLGALPAWLFQIVLPLAFLLIAYRYAVLFVHHLQLLLARRPA